MKTFLSAIRGRIRSWMTVPSKAGTLETATVAEPSRRLFMVGAAAVIAAAVLAAPLATSTEAQAQWHSRRRSWHRRRGSRGGWHDRRRSWHRRRGSFHDRRRSWHRRSGSWHGRRRSWHRRRGSW